MTIFDTLARVASQYPHAQALVCSPSGICLSYSQLLACASALASSLVERGVKHGDRVASLSHNDPQALVLFFALAKLGAIWVPLNWRLTPTEWQTVLNDCDPVGLLVSPALHEQAVGLRTPLWDFSMPLEGGGQEFTTQARMDDAALIVYTSGTTGKPKGAVYTHANLLANMAAAQEACSLTPADRVLSCLPLFHVGGLCIHTLPALGVGATVLLHERFDAGTVLQSIANDQPSLLLQVPTTLAALCAHPTWANTTVSSLRAVWAGSSIVSAQAAAAFHARGVPVCNVYGCTESGPVSVVLGPDHAVSRLGWVGWPALGVQLKLLNAMAIEGDQFEGGQLGEIALKAPHVITHYWPHLPALDTDGFLHTGDMAQLASDGCLRVIGRATELIISGGENIYPAEVEAALLQHPQIAQCAVFGLSDSHWGEVVAAAVVWVTDVPLKAPPEALSIAQDNESTSISYNTEQMSNYQLHLLLQNTEQIILHHLSTRLAKYKHPRRIQLLPSLPTTALGKVQKDKLRAMLS